MLLDLFMSTVQAVKAITAVKVSNVRSYKGNMQLRRFNFKSWSQQC